MLSISTCNYTHSFSRHLVVLITNTAMDTLTIYCALIHTCSTYIHYLQGSLLTLDPFLDASFGDDTSRMKRGVEPNILDQGGSSRSRLLQDSFDGSFDFNFGQLNGFCFHLRFLIILVQFKPVQAPEVCPPCVNVLDKV